MQKNTAEKIKEDNKKKKEKERADEEKRRLNNVEIQLKQFGPDEYSNAIDLIERNLINCENTDIRLNLLRKKFDFQRQYLRLLKSKSNLNEKEQAQFDLLQIGYFATLVEITDLEKLSNPFEQKKSDMKELLNPREINQEVWYRFQLEKINSRLPRRDQSKADSRAKDFKPDPWQIKFLDAVDQRQSIVLVAPTGSGNFVSFIIFLFSILIFLSLGKTYASYYAMEQIRKGSSNGICVYVAPTIALTNQVAGMCSSIDLKYIVQFLLFFQEQFIPKLDLILDYLQ
jgi:superfamily II RNA helicase